MSLRFTTPSRSGVTSSIETLRARRLRDALHRLMFERSAVDAKSIGRYELRRLVGVGGMGIVYEAWDPKLSRSVAVKLLRRGLFRSPEEADARLIQEARAVARLRHPHVVEVFDVGTHDRDGVFGPDAAATGGSVFVVMEFVCGRTVAEWVFSESPPADRIVAVMLQAASALDASHRAGLVHRDFKPSNVLIDRQGCARVVDFGLARAAPEAFEGPNDGRRIDESTHGGTPFYMAPERLSGAEADARSDQYAYCLTLFELLDGLALKRWVDGSMPLARCLRTSNVPRGVRPVLQRGLREDPRHRYDSMADVVDALATFGPPRRRAVTAALVFAGSLSAGNCFGANPDPACERPPTFLERPRAASPELAASLQRLDDYGRQWQAHWRSACELDEPSHRSAALSCLEARRKAHAFATAAITERHHDPAAVVDALQLAGPCLAGEGSPFDPRLAELRAEIRHLDRLGEWDAGIAWIDAELADASDLAFAAALRIERSGLLLARGEVEASREAAMTAWADAERIGDEALTFAARLAAVEALHGLARYQDAWELLRLSERQAEAMGYPTDVVVQLRELQGRVASSEQDFESARAYLEDAQELSRDLTAPPSERDFTVATALATAQGHLGELPAATETLIHAREREVLRVGANDPRIATVAYDISQLLRAQGRYRRAWGYAVEAYGVGQRPQNTARARIETLEELAIVELHLGHADVAFELATRYLREISAVVGERHLAVADAQLALAVSATMLGRPSEALAAADLGLRTHELATTPMPTLAGALWLVSAEAALTLGEVDRGLAAAHNAVVSMENADAPFGMLANARVGLARALIARGSLSAGRELLSELGVSLGAASDRELDRAALWRISGDALLEAGDLHDARVAFSRALDDPTATIDDTPAEAVAAALGLAEVHARLGEHAAARGMLVRGVQWIRSYGVRTLAAAETMDWAHASGVIEEMPHPSFGELRVEDVATQRARARRAHRLERRSSEDE